MTGHQATPCNGYVEISMLPTRKIRVGYLNLVRSFLGSTQEWLEAITGTVAASKATGKKDPWLWEHIFSLACIYTTDSLLDYPPTLPPEANNPLPQQEILSDCRTLSEHDPTVFMREKNIFFLF